MIDRKEFKEKLNAIHQWPSLYMFKFIVEADQVDALRAIFPKHTTNTKPSSKGKYISVTIQMMASSAEEVMTKYDEAYKIKGIISL